MMIRLLTFLIFSLFIATDESIVYQENTSSTTQSLIIEEKENSDLFYEILKERYEKFYKDFEQEKVYVQLDKPMYKPGETMWFSVFVRNQDFKITSLSEIVHVDLYAPNGSKIKELSLKLDLGKARGDILLSPDVVGGQYKIKAYTQWQKNVDFIPEAYMFEKNITIHKPVLPNLRMSLEFREASYGKGDKVTADVAFKTLDDNALRYQSFDYTVNIDGKKALSKTMQTDFDGKAVIEFDLPKDLASNDGSLNVMIPYNVLTESISKAIPITLNKIDLQFMPEGGVLVADVENTVGFKAVNDLGKPVEIEATLIYQDEKVLQTIKTYHQGMGKFTFKPSEKIKVRITKPQGVEGDYTLPKAENTLSLQVIQRDEKFTKVKIIGQRTNLNTIIAHSRGKIHFRKTLKANEGNIVKIRTEDLPLGTTLITLGDERLKPIAERMIFLHRDKNLNINIKTDKQKYAPREKVKMDIEVKDHTGKPVNGQFALAVVDDKLLSYADDKQANIYGDLLLTSELKGEVVEPNFYFDNPEKYPHKDQDLALDLLMMTQGWRSWYDKIFDDSLAIAYQPKKRRVSGTVHDYKGGFQAGITVSIPELKRKTKTNEEGYFEFTNIDLKEAITLKLKKNKVINTMKINDYKHYEIPFVLDPSDNIVRNRIANADKTTAKLTGKILDEETGEELLFCSVAIFKADSETLITGAQTDLDGYFSIANIEAGKYKIHISYPGYQLREYYLTLNSNEIIQTRIKLKSGSINTDEVIIVSHREPLIRSLEAHPVKEEKKVIEIPNPNLLQIQDNNPNPSIRSSKSVSGRMINASDIKQLPTRSLSGMVATAPGASSIDDGLGVTIRGSRSNANVIYIDGIRVNGILHLNCNHEGMQIEMSGTSANYLNNGRIDKSVDEINESISQQQKEYHEEPTPSIKSTRMVYRNYRNFVLDQNNFRSAAKYLLDGELIPNEIVFEVFENIHPSEVTKFKRSTKKAHKIYDKYGVYIIETNYKNHPKYKNYKESLNDWMTTNLKEYNESAVNYNKETSYIDRVVNGIEIPYTDLFHLLENLENDYETLAKTSGKLDTMADFIGTYIKEKPTINEIPEVELYQYALGFQKGFYQPRAYYVPKYNTKKEKNPERNDFRSTIYWNPDLQLDRNGKTTVEFYAADNITTYRVVLEGISSRGDLGRNEATFYAQMPFGMTTKIPSIVLNGDVVNIPVTLMNNTEEEIEGKLKINAPYFLQLKENITTKVSIPANGTKTLFLKYLVKGQTQQVDFKVKFTANSIEDAFSQSIAVQQIGFPRQSVYNGSIGDSIIAFNLEQPLDSSIVGTLNIFPSNIVEIIALSKRMIRRPTGCFEQTSSKNYPNILVYKYLNETQQLDEETKARLERFTDEGYKRLMGYEIKGGGFDWYGRGPADMRLTAYGLMQFTEMSDIYPVSKKMLKRTANWLLSRKDGKGSWNTSRYETGSTKKVPTFNAYINWALTEAGYGDEIQKEISQSYEDALESNHSYQLALLANILLEMDDVRADTVLAKLLENQQEDGSWTGTGYTAFGSSGKNLTMETTALSILALYKAVNKNKYQSDKEIGQAIYFLKSSKTYHGFGSTQATVLSLKALEVHTRNSKYKTLDGQYAVFINKKIIMEGQYDSEASKTITIEGLGGQLINGKNTLKVLFSKDTEPLPFDLDVSYTSAIPETKQTSDVSITTSLNQHTVKMGETIRLTTTIKNLKDKEIPNTIALVGIPSSLSVQPKQLNELKEKLAFDYYELIDGYIVFHFISMEAKAEKVIHLDLKADFKGQFTAPASSAYLYYTDDKVDWTEGLEILIQ